MEIEDMAVAVIPIGSPFTQIVITLTVEATRRIACLKPVARSGSVSRIIEAVAGYLSAKKQVCGSISRE